MAKLKPRARIIRTIGDQLISGPEAALIELVKNSFDADSPFVNIKIAPRTANSRGKITIEDNGHGMSYDDVVGKWFEPATDDKKIRPTSPNGRKFLGAKGIGRFAAARLGEKTELLSICNKDKGSIEEVLVSIDWGLFTSEKYLEDLDIPVDHLIREKNKTTKTGISISITDLRDDWTKNKLGNLIHELRRVASPSEIGDEFKIRLDLSEFTDEKFGFDGRSLFRERNRDLDLLEASDEDPWLIQPFRVQEYADYKLAGRFDETGAFIGTFTICKGDNKPQPLSLPGPLISADESNCGTLDLSLNVYDRETESIEELFRRMELDFDKIGIRAARKILTDNSGISIFRNGFRIRPYGEPENDWLELERQRVQNPSKKLGISQVSGRITIQAEQESSLIERSSREGLEHNGAFERLKTLIRNVLLHVEDRRVDFREKAGLSRRAAGDVEQAKSLASLKNALKEVSKLPAELQQPLRKALEKDSAALVSSLEEIDAYQHLLQSRASLGLVVSQVIHEGRRILNPMAESARSLKEDSSLLIETSKKGEVARKQLPEHTEVLSKGTKDLSKLFKRLDPVSGRRRGKPSTFQAATIISSSLKLFEETIKEHSIVVDIDLSAAEKVRGYADDLQAASLNIIENAIHWLSTTNQPLKKIEIRSKSNKKKTTISISNNGPLIDESYYPRLFVAGFSLKSDGTGLGLAIAREACRASKGDILFDPNKSDTTFLIEFPTA